MKYYRVLKDNFLWKAGAILSDNVSKSTTGDGAGYSAIEDIWNVVPTVQGEYISARIVEHPDNSKYFQRVYTDNVAGKLFRTKDQLVNLYTDSFK